MPDAVCTWQLRDPLGYDNEDEGPVECGLPAVVVFTRRVKVRGTMQHTQRYYMCRKHSSPATRSAAEDQGYLIEEIP